MFLFLGADDFKLFILLRYFSMADETERTPLLTHEGEHQSQQLHESSSSSSMNKDPEATAEEVKMADTAVGERLKYNDYTTIDWLHDLVQRLMNTAI